MSIEILKVIADNSYRWELQIKNSKQDVMTCYVFWRDVPPDYEIINGENYIDDPILTAKLMEFIIQYINCYDK